MAIKTTIARSILALTLATTPLAAGLTGMAGIAHAKGGNGGGGDHGGGSDHGKSSSGAEKERGNSREKSHRGKSGEAHAAKAARTETGSRHAPGLRSLDRNFHAYLNSNDPRMTAIAAYAVAYAEFEAANGVDVEPTDPALGDEALRDALASFTKDGVVTDAMVDEAKSILGVGDEVGKIDQIRETLPETDTETAE
ncbi:UNVERIFIED_ORG: hypothetical protein LHK14_22850 (plasmid) [Roseateles sp. XES5]|nr:hypothetical protein [Roseateles sp. XES5]